MSKGGSEIKETAQQRAMADFAVNQLQDYTKRWLPLQKRLAAQTMESGAAGSAARKSAAGRSNVDTQIAFAGAGDMLEKKLAGSGRNPATALTGQRSCVTRCTSMARLRGVVRAFLWMFIRLSPMKLIGSHQSASGFQSG